MILLFLLSFSILPIILTFLEILFVKKNLKYKNIKYIRLLKIFELITPFIALIVSQGPRQVIGMTFLVFFFLFDLFIFHNDILWNFNTWFLGKENY